MHGNIILQNGSMNWPTHRMWDPRVKIFYIGQTYHEYHDLKSAIKEILFIFFEKGQKAIKEIRIQSNQGILLSHSVFERHIYDPSLQSYRLIECNTVSHLISFITLNRNFCSMIYVSLITIFQVFDSYLFIFSS